MDDLGTAAPVSSIRAQLGEGPRWDADRRRLLWVDIEGGTVHALGEDGEHVLARLDAKVGAVAPCRDGRLLAALADRLVAVDPATGDVRTLASIPHARDGMRCNDGACDAAGRFWIGTMAEDETPGAGALYRFDPDGRLHTVLTGVTLSNGLGWDPSGRVMYYIDTPTQRVDRFAFDPGSGELADRRPFAEVPSDVGAPDGLAVDSGGAVWVAVYGGREVRRFAPDGRLTGRVGVPADHVTACCFGGADGRRLFVTTAARGVAPERAASQPDAGRVFALDVPASGPPAHSFGGAG